MTRSAVHVRATALVLGVAGWLWVGEPSLAAACFIVPVPPYAIDAKLRELDSTPPTPFRDVTALGIRIASMHCDGEYCTAASCPDWGGLRITFAPPSDDQTPDDDLGYRVVWTGSTLPRAMGDVIGQVWPLGSGDQLSIELGFDAVSDLQGSLELIAVDRAGNESAPSVSVPVKVLGCTTYFDQPTCDEEEPAPTRAAQSTGCSVAPRKTLAWQRSPVWALPLVAAGLARWRRRT